MAGRGFILGLFLLSACSATPPGADFNDPYEAQNRKIHAGNVALDRAMFGSESSTRPLPAPVTRALGNFTDNLGTPSSALNSLLQARPEPLVKNTFRFLINSTVGLGGVFDPASVLGIPKADTDFGETLHVWGAPEGAFLMLPVLGPSTERDLAGKVVDAVTDPLGAVVHRPESDYLLGAKLANKVNERLSYSDVVDSVLYDSADSYAQLRLFYLQNRRHELGEEADVIDPYEDPYGQ